MNKKYYFIIGIFSLVIALTAFEACSHRNDAEGAGAVRRGGPHQGVGAQARRGGPAEIKGGGRMRAAAESLRLTEAEVNAITLETEAAAYRPMKSALQATGKIQAHQFRQAIVSYPFPARIAQIHVRPGDWVEPGKPLVTLQSEAVGEAKAAFFKSQADYELARNNYERENRLFDRGAGAGKNLQIAEAELKGAEAARNAAEKKLHILGFTEEQIHASESAHEINPLITLFAPIAGNVAENAVVMGGMVDQATEILTILDPRMLCVDADIYERDISKIRLGQRVDVSVPAFPELVFKGTLKYIGDTLKEDTRTVTVRTEVENDGRRLKPGMFASLDIVLEERIRALTVPAAAVLDDGKDKIVFVRKGDEFFRRVIETKSRVNGFLEVVGGLSEGEDVVVKGNYQLKSKLYDEILKAAGIH
ncbi:MAG: efflux RND transporter periplasmic adaptor subunit [Candidatus Aminicenantes bacterium]|nr:efflux RND transporter periplasmic adaptor subunit [Candidatus Aminicenantes bacterium]